MTYANFSDRVFNLRTDRGMSVVGLSKELGFSRKSITDWESGRVLPGFDAIIALAYAFDVSADYILCLTDDPTPHKR